MNRCFIMGKILTEPIFDFLYMNKIVSVARFMMKLINHSEIKVLGFDDIADYIYQDLKPDDIIIIEAEIRSNDNGLEFVVLELIKVA